jgi:hypothetical protein
MSRFTLLIIVSFVLGVPALAQFEVAPDHFDGDAQKPPAQQAKAKAKSKTTGQVTTSAAATGAQQGKQGQATGTSSKQTVAPLHSAGANTGRAASYGASTTSHKKHLRKTRTVSTLHSARKSPTESPTPQ